MTFNYKGIAAATYLKSHHHHYPYLDAPSPPCAICHSIQYVIKNKFYSILHRYSYLYAPSPPLQPTWTRHHHFCIYLDAPSWWLVLVDSFKALSSLKGDASGAGSEQRGQSGVALAARQQISRPLIDSIEILVEVFLTLTGGVADRARQSSGRLSSGIAAGVFIACLK